MIYLYLFFLLKNKNNFFSGIFNISIIIPRTNIVLQNNGNIITDIIMKNIGIMIVLYGIYNSKIEAIQNIIIRQLKIINKNISRESLNCDFTLVVISE